MVDVELSKKEFQCLFYPHEVSATGLFPKCLNVISERPVSVFFNYKGTDKKKKKKCYNRSHSTVRRSYDIDHLTK